MQEVKHILAIDCETNDRARDYKGRQDDVDNWPRICQVGCVMARHDGKVVHRFESLVSPDGWAMNPQAEGVHGISEEMCRESGEHINSVLDRVLMLSLAADAVVMHNSSFDWPVLQCEAIRCGKRVGQPGSLFCTMKQGTYVCRIPSPFGFKWPKLGELHEHLFGVGFEGAHSALADAEACLRCYLKMNA